MPVRLISLDCTGCGATLEISDDMERFACSYCGEQMAVQRRGGSGRQIDPQQFHWADPIFQREPQDSALFLIERKDLQG